MKTVKLLKHILPFPLVLILFIISLFAGSESIPFFEVLKILTFSPEADFFNKIILLDLRLSRSVLAFLTGALLAGSGTLFQGYFQNPLADTGIMGISAGATFGAVLSGFFSFSITLTVSIMGLSAFIGSLLTGLLVYLLAHRNVYSQNAVSLLLVGTALGTFLSALTSIILLANFREMHTVYIWTLGSFNGKGWDDFLFALFPSLLSFLLFVLITPSLDTLTGGEKTAQSLGVKTKSVRFWVLTAGSLATATAVCSGGTISFIGLIAPHICRKIYGPSHRKLLVFSTLYGGAFLLFSDILARTLLAPTEIPVGIITALFGAPFFMYAINKRSTLLG